LGGVCMTPVWFYRGDNFSLHAMKLILTET